MPLTRDLGDGFEALSARCRMASARWSALSFSSIISGLYSSSSGKGMDVRPHPHIGLATVTYLFQGSMFHRDSEGNAQEIAPGAMNLMTAGARASLIPSARRRRSGASGQGLLRHPVMDRAA